MHITYCSPSWPPAGAANGIVTYVAAIRDYLLRQGHQVSVLADGRLHLADGATVALDPPPRPRDAFWRKMASRIDRRLGHHPFIARQIARQLRQACRVVPIDLVEMEESFGWSGTIADRLDVPVVTRLHGPQFLKSARDREMVSPRHGAERARAEGRAIRKAEALTAPTAALLAATHAHYRCAPQRSKIIPNPVAAPAGDQWQLDQCDRDTLLCVGRLDIAKGADLMVAAFTRVLTERPSARLIMVGPEGQVRQPDGSGVAFLDHIAARTPRSALRRIRFVGRLEPASIWPLRRRAFLTVMPSPNETFSYTALEAMATGCPLIATNWPGASEIIEDGVTGWLTPVGDASAMAAKIGWVLDHPDIAARVGADARRAGTTTFSVETVGAAMVDFYQEILAGRRAS